MPQVPTGFESRFGEPWQRWVCSSVEQTNRYLDQYQSAREITFNEEEHRAAWAAGTWQLAFNAKKEVARGGRTPLGDALSEQRAARLARLSG